MKRQQAPQPPTMQQPSNSGSRWPSSNAAPCWNYFFTNNYVTRRAFFFLQRWREKTTLGSFGVLLQWLWLSLCPLKRCHQTTPVVCHFFFCYVRVRNCRGGGGSLEIRKRKKISATYSHINNRLLV
jgi:hypothetical protein